MSHRRMSFACAGLLAGGLFLWPVGCGSTPASQAPSPPPETLAEPAVARIRPAPESTTVAAASDVQAVSTPLPKVSAPAPVAEAAPGAKPDVYTMQKGDTLYAIARKFNVPPKQLLALNHFPDPNHLPVGTKVRIP